MGTKRIPSFGAAALLIIAFLASLPAFGDPASQAVDEARIRELKPVWDGALLFRQLALKDYRQALADCASEPAREVFRALDKDVWGDIDPVAGWSFFMNTSVLIVASTDGPRPIIAFYHPFSDVFLVTAWERAQGRALLADTEVFIGDWVRNRATPPFDVLPLWRRGQMFLPAALGQAVADSVRSLEEIFMGWNGDDWRARIGKAPKGLRGTEVDRACASLMLAQSLRTIDKFALPEADEPEMLGALRLELALTFDRIRAKGLEKTLSAADLTLPMMKSMLRSIPEDAWRSLVVVGTVVGTKDAIAFMTPAFHADFCLSFYFAGVPDELRLRRVDVIYYPGWYKYSVEAGRGAPGAGR